MKKDRIDYDRIGSFITILREERGIDQKTLAKELNVSTSAICQWESTGHIKTENLYELAVYFGITVDELINADIDKERQVNLFSKKYDLEKYPVFDEINERNINYIREYLLSCYKVMNRFYYLTKKTVEDEATEKEFIECDYLSQFFDTDEAFIESCYGIPEPTGAVFSLSEKHLDDEEYNYELSKIYAIKLKINPVSILDFEDDLSTDYLLKLLSEVEKCQLLTQFFNKTSSIQEIEKSRSIRRLLQNGGQLLFGSKKHGKEHILKADELKLFEGEVVEDNAYSQYCRIKDAKFNQKAEITNNVYADWKNYSFYEIHKLIDYKTTEYLKLLIEHKEKSPLLFYEEICKLNENQNKKKGTIYE